MKRINLKPIIITTILIVIQATCYLIAKALEGEANLIGNAFDDNTPFIIYAIIPYCIWYIMLFIVPYILYKRDSVKFSKYCLSYIFVALISSIIFIIYPTTIYRPVIEGYSFIEQITKFIYWLDTPILNCFPSIHCSISMLWILFIFNLKDTKLHEKIIISLISVLIMLSTLLIKQHVVIDLISGDIIAIVVFFVIKYENKLTIKVKELLNI